MDDTKDIKELAERYKDVFLNDGIMPGHDQLPKETQELIGLAYANETGIVADLESLEKELTLVEWQVGMIRRSIKEGHRVLLDSNGQQLESFARQAHTLCKQVASNIETRAFYSRLIPC